MTKHIGFISTRFSGTDGVTMEASKWSKVLKQNGHSCFWFAGELDRDPNTSFLVPEAHFKHEKNQWINDRVFGYKKRNPTVTDTIFELKVLLKERIQTFISQFHIDLLIAQNVLTIPLHIPMGIALTEIIAETQIPTIAHHHDFYWERPRFSVNAVGDYLRMSFPPNLNNIEHVVINSGAQEELALRTGISSTIIPNVLDFENPPEIDAEQTASFRNSMDLEPQDHIILQPTRIVQRKGIEHAIELVESLKNPQYKLVISHEAGDEGYEYSEWLLETARERGVDLVQEYDHAIARKSLDHFLTMTGMDEQEFWHVADTFRDPRVWWIRKGQWWKDTPWGEPAPFGKVHLSSEEQKKYRMVQA